MKSSASEHSDLSIRGVALTAAAIFVGVLVSLALAAWCMRGYQHGLGPEMLFANGVSKTTTLQTDRRLVDQDRKRLETYGWIDRDRGVVHIPISRAMTLLCDEAQKEHGSP